MLQAKPVIPASLTCTLPELWPIFGPQSRLSQRHLSSSVPRKVSCTTDTTTTSSSSSLLLPPLQGLLPLIDVACVFEARHRLTILSVVSDKTRCVPAYRSPTFLPSLTLLTRALWLYTFLVWSPSILWIGHATQTIRLLQTVRCFPWRAWLSFGRTSTSRWLTLCSKDTESSWSRCHGVRLNARLPGATSPHTTPTPAQSSRSVGRGLRTRPQHLFNQGHPLAPWLTPLSSTSTPQALASNKGHPRTRRPGWTGRQDKEEGPRWGDGEGGRRRIPIFSENGFGEKMRMVLESLDSRRVRNLAVSLRILKRGL